MFNLQKADLHNLKKATLRTPWDLVFEDDCIHTNVTNKIHLVFTVTDEHVPKITIKDTNWRPWIDKDIIARTYAIENQKFIYSRISEARQELFHKLFG